MAHTKHAKWLRNTSESIPRSTGREKNRSQFFSSAPAEYTQKQVIHNVQDVDKTHL